MVITYTIQDKEFVVLSQKSLLQGKKKPWDQFLLSAK